MPSDAKTKRGQDVERKEREKGGERWKERGEADEWPPPVRVRGSIASITVGTIEAISGRWDEGRGESSALST